MLRTFCPTAKFIRNYSSYLKYLDFYKNTDPSKYKIHAQIMQESYYFNSKGILLNINDNSAYKFSTPEHYEKISTLANSFVQEMLIKQFGMSKISYQNSNIFISSILCFK